MANEVKISQDDLYAARIFFHSALPLLKVIAESEPKFGNKFKGKSFVFQVSAAYDAAEGGKMATHFVIEDGVFTEVNVGKIHESPDLEFAFPDLKKFIIFFAGKGMPLPKIKGMFKFGFLIPILTTLLRMAGLLQAKDAPKKQEDQVMLVKLYFYLLTSGISQLNKMGQPDAKAFASSPDRAFAFKVEGYPELQAYLRVKQGNSKAGRGEYKRCKPFLSMIFDNTQHALDILMSKGDMIEYMKSSWLRIDGAPEFGGTLGNVMMLVGYYAQGTYLG